MITIENEFLAVTADSRGGMLRSVRGKENGIEYLWQGDPAYWGGQAPNLFPFVGRLYQEKYTYKGETYPMKRHGFLSKMELAGEQTAPDRCVFTLTDSPETREIYPFQFQAQVEYALEGRRLNICFRAENRGEETMYCGFGGHPGFNIPLEPGLAFEDYQVSFPTACTPNVVEFSSGVLTLGKKPYSLTEGRCLPLEHSLFDSDAVVLCDCPREVTVSSPKGSHGVTVRCPDMPYIGLWHVGGKAAPYVCVEPWSVCPGREGVVEDLAAMADMTAIAPGAEAVNAWSIELF